MSYLSDYEQRTSWKWEPIQGIFPTAEGLVSKVYTDGSYAPFPGSTVVMRADPKCIRIIQLMQDVLYEKLDGTGMLAMRFPAHTTHMTLHDLVAPDLCRCDPDDPEEYRAEVSESLRKAMSIVEAMRRDLAGRRIEMIPDRIVNMMSKSLVLLLRPQTEEDAALLMEMHHRLDAVLSLPYPLTPHITLAYFRPGMLDGDLLGEVVQEAQVDAEDHLVFPFDVESVTAQWFANMQDYTDLPERVCFCCDGGLNRSVMAASIMNHLAEEKGLPVQCAARSAFENTQGLPVPEEVLKTLEHHGIRIDPCNRTARFFEKREITHFTQFTAISDGAMGHLMACGVSSKRMAKATGLFLGIPDPAYGDISYEDVFAELYERAELYLNFLQRRMVSIFGS